MRQLWLKLSLRNMRRHISQTLLTIMGIALGVATVVSVDIANHSSKKALTMSLQTLSGATTHFISGGPDGIPEELYTTLKTELGLHQIAPRVQANIIINNKSYTLLGIDIFAEQALKRHELINQLNPLSQKSTLSTKSAAHRSKLGIDLRKFLTEPNSVILEENTAQAINTKKELTNTDRDSFTLKYQGKEHKIKIAGVYSHSDQKSTKNLASNLIYTDISSAQELLNRVHSIDQIDLILSEGEAEHLTSWLPPSVKLIDTRTRNHSLQQLADSFHINLSAMSLLSLLVGGLLIYNTFTFSVLRRRNQLGLLRCLGQTPKEMFLMIMGEAALFAVIGTLLGVIMGILMGHYLVVLVTRTINDLYFVLTVRTFFWDYLTLIKGVSLGFGVTFLAVLIPAREAASTPAFTLQKRSNVEKKWKKNLFLISILGVSLMAIGSMLTHSTFINIASAPLKQGFIGLALEVIGFSLLVPMMLIFCNKTVLILSKPWLTSPMIFALRSISSNLSRTGLAVAALSVAVAVTIGVGIMITSFRGSVDTWLEHTLSGDIYITTQGRASSRASIGIPLSFIERVQVLPGVANVNRTRIGQIETNLGLQRLLAVDERGQRSKPQLISRTQNAEENFLNGKGVMISEPLAYHHQLKAGDAIILHSDKGPMTLNIEGIFVDYTSSKGLITLPLSIYKQLWNDEGISTLVVNAQDPTDLDRLIQQINGLAREFDQTLIVRSNKQLREISLEIFDRTFAVTDVLRILAVIVALIGVLSALLAIQLEQRQQFAILRACGTTPRQIVSTILSQTLLLGLYAGLFAIPLGWLMSEILIDIINRAAFGWSMEKQFPISVIYSGLITSLAAAFIAALYPTWHTSRTNISEALRHE